MSLLLQRQGCSLHVTFELSGWDCDGKIKIRGSICQSYVVLYHHISQ